MKNKNYLEIVLSSVDPNYSSNFDLKILQDDIDLFDSTVRFAKRNGLYYHFVNSLINQGISLPPSGADDWHKELQRLHEFKETIKLLNKITEEYKKKYIIIKLCNRVPYIPRDVDIFVNSIDQLAIINALKDKGMFCSTFDVTEIILQKPGYVDIELYGSIHYIGMDFIDCDFIWSSIIDDQMFDLTYPGLNNEANFILMLIHRLIGHRSMSLLDFLHLVYLMGEVDIDLCKTHASKEGWGHTFDLAMNKLTSIYIDIYEKNAKIDFPYLFHRSFLLECISSIDGLNMSLKQRVFLDLSILLDLVIYHLKDTYLYNALKSFGPTRRFINFFTRNIRKMRGDVHG
jgi:hypothetical protein